MRPRVLLLDEPLATLDAKLRESLRDEFAELRRRTGSSTAPGPAHQVTLDLAPDAASTWVLERWCVDKMGLYWTFNDR